MRLIDITPPFRPCGPKKPAAALLLGFLALSAQVTRAADAEKFFNNWFVTGDYAVAGVGMRGTGVNGWATGTITMPPLPLGAEPIAAFLYWSTTESGTDPVARDGYFRGYPIRGVVLGDLLNPNLACEPNRWAYSYRADVLRYIPVDKNNVRQASGPHTVKLPDSGAGGGNVLTNGASLVVIYRIVLPGVLPIPQLRAVVAYNGSFTMNSSRTMTQTVAGFYQADDNASAKVTYIAANGQSGFVSPLYVNNNQLDSDPFLGGRGSRWDNPTYRFNLAENASSFNTQVMAGNSQACVTLVATVASMEVKDSDNDGLLDIWEAKGLHRNTTGATATFGTCSDYPGEPENCVNLSAMGANPSKKDIFVQLDWMHGTGDGTGGTDGRGAHSHMPKPDALQAVCATFANRGINLHFDVGNNFQGQPCVVPAAYAKGGADISEDTLRCADGRHTCNYHTPYPVLSFEFGFASVRDGNNKTIPPISAHFSQARYWTHHYGLFAHALAGPFNSSGQPVDPNSGLPLTAPIMPRSYSGIAQRPGGGFMVTLGLWRSDIPENDQVGSSLVQAGTLMHELGHNLSLGHAGLFTKPNCIPNYQSTMNYSYQTRGLTDKDGLEHIDFSNGFVTPLWEAALGPLFNLRYRVRHFGPLAPGTPANAAAKLHCDGTPITDNALEVRLEGPTVGTPDWSNGTGKAFPLAWDVNFDGTKGQILWDQPDWLILNLQQIGSGPNFGALSVGAWATDGGVFATDGGVFATDAGALATDGGVFATDAGVFATDGGAFATDGGVFATDAGALATDAGALATDAGEEDYETHNASGPDAPAGLTATNELNDVLLKWNAPGTGAVLNYDIYRCAGAGCTPAAFRRGWVPPLKAAPTFTDTVIDFIHAGTSCPADKTCYNTTYTYQVLANVMVVVAGVPTTTSSPLSNSASSEVTHLFVIANNLGPAVYGTTPNPDPTSAFTLYGKVLGTLSGVTCGYGNPPGTVVPRNVGNYPIYCTGPASTSPTDGVTYNAPYLTYTPGGLTITRRPITVTAASTKVYDGTTNSATLPAISPLPLAYADTPAFYETYDNKNVGSNHRITPAGFVNDGNGGSNYNVTFVSINTGVITPRPLTVSAMGVNKVYDGTIAATVTLSDDRVPGDALTDSYTSASFSDKNVGNGKSVTVTGIAVSGTDAGNYSLSNTTATTTANIAPAPLTIRANDASKTYGQALTFAGTEFTSTGLKNSDTVGSVTLTSAGAPAGAAAGIYTIVPGAAVGTGLNNYTIAYLNGTLTVNPPPALADLIVESLTHSPAVPNTTELITFTAVVRNAGAAAAGPSTLEFRVGGETPGEPQTRFAVPALAPGSSYTVQRQVTLPISQAYRNTATADVDNVVPESNEVNNVTTDDYTVVASLISCSYPSGSFGIGADLIDRGFYVPSYPGTTLNRVDLKFSANAAGTYNLSLTARTGAYDGAVLGTGTASVTLTNDVNAFVPVSFYFPSALVAPGSTVTFAVAGAPANAVYFGIPASFPGDASCPVIETESTTPPPLDTFRRNGVDVKIY